MNDEHKLELLKALREHGKNIEKFAAGGMMPSHPGTVTAFEGPGATLGGPITGAGSPSRTTGVLGGLNDFLGTQSNFQAGSANIQPGTNVGQLNTSYNQAQTGLGDQQAFLNALQAQNGVQNQSDVYNQMQDIAAGRGPNPATALLNNATGANVANQAAIMAGARGASANPGLIARQAAQTGAQTQQNAIGQAAALQANQSLNATNNAANIANTQVNQQGNATAGLNNAVQNEQQILQNANAAANNNAVGMQSNMNNVNAQISQGNQNAGNNFLGNVAKSIPVVGSVLGSLFGAEGGEVPSSPNGPKSKTAHVLKSHGPAQSKAGGAEHLASALTNMKSGGGVPGKAKVGGATNTEKNDTVPALLSPEEIVLPRSVTKSDDPVANAAKFVASIMAKKGRMPGKAKAS